MLYAEPHPSKQTQTTQRTKIERKRKRICSREMEKEKLCNKKCKQCESMKIGRKFRVEEMDGERDSSVHVPTAKLNELYLSTRVYIYVRIYGHRNYAFCICFEFFWVISMTFFWLFLWLFWLFL